MTLVESLHREIATTLGLRPQPEWYREIHAAIDACAASESPSEELRSRILANVATRITVPETHFFRNHEQLNACAEHLVRVALDEHRPAELWVAGCATGEEPYTVGILVDRSGARPLSERLTVTASDINPHAISKARDASYTSWSFRGAPGWCFSYFEAVGPGRVRLRDNPIREAVKFTVESCQHGAQVRRTASLDAISFRNVAIYLEDFATRHLHGEFARLLRPGGLLLLGPSDPRPQDSRFEFEGYHDDAPVYRRVGSPRPTPKPATSFRPSVPRAALESPTIKVEHRGSNVPVRVIRPTPQELHRSEPKVSNNRQETHALEVVRQLAENTPVDSIALRILGQMHLSRGEAENATEALRRAVFVDPTDVLSRYFYALALREVGEARQSLKQLRNVTQGLERMPPDDLLSDQSTTAKDLLTAARFLEEQWT